MAPLSSHGLKLQAFGKLSLKTKKSCQKIIKKWGKSSKNLRNGDENNKNKDNKKLQNYKEICFFLNKIGKKYHFKLTKKIQH